MDQETHQDSRFGRFRATVIGLYARHRTVGGFIRGLNAIPPDAGDVGFVPVALAPELARRRADERAQRFRRLRAIALWAVLLLPAIAFFFAGIYVLFWMR